MKINFVTQNKLKFDIARAFFLPLGEDYELYQLTVEIPEIQAETVEEVAIFSAKEAAKIVNEPCIVSDVGFVIEALKGFPGPFVKYANTWLGTGGFLKLLDGTKNRRAYFEHTLVVAFPDGSVKAFTRREYGTVAAAAKKPQSGWATNDLFIPDGYDISLGQMSDDEQVVYWGDGAWPDVVAYLQELSDEQSKDDRR